MNLPPLPYPQIPGNDYTASDMREYGALCRKQALEEAVLICEAFRGKDVSDAWDTAAASCAEAIRELSK